MDLGRFSVSLAVKDIKASLEFYQRMGFQPLSDYGGIEEKWLILANGDYKIGLFENMLPSNYLTFNPQDARALHKELKASGATFTASNVEEKESGPCYFMMADPDGNLILIDQHNE